MGRVLYFLICRGRLHRAKEEIPFWLQPSVYGEKVFLTMGKNLIDAPYSIAFRRLIMRMLAYDYRIRPEPRELLRIVKDILANESVWESPYTTDKKAELDQKIEHDLWEHEEGRARIVREAHAARRQQPREDQMNEPPLAQEPVPQEDSGRAGLTNTLDNLNLRHGPRTGDEQYHVSADLSSM